MKNDALPPIDPNDMVRMEGAPSSLVQLEDRLQEIGGGDWKGLGFRNDVLAAHGWRPEDSVHESDREAKAEAYASAWVMMGELDWRPSREQVQEWFVRNRGSAAPDLLSAYPKTSRARVWWLTGAVAIVAIVLIAGWVPIP